MQVFISLSYSPVILRKKHLRLFHLYKNAVKRHLGNLRNLGSDLKYIGPQAEKINRDQRVKDAFREMRVHTKVMDLLSTEIKVRDMSPDDLFIDIVGEPGAVSDHYDFYQYSRMKGRDKGPIAFRVVFL